MMITVYVPQEYLTNLVSPHHLPKPSSFWLAKPDGWDSKNLATITISSDIWARWNSPIKEHVGGKQLLKD